MNIPVYKPKLASKTKEYVNDCIDSSWISSKGKYVSKFETEFSKFLNISHSCSVTNGTVALHLALASLGLSHNDEVITPSLTYIATVNAINYVGAKPVLVDSDIKTWNIDIPSVERKITKKTKAILAVHLYGNPCNMSKLLELCKRHNLFLIEDSAEAFGSKYQGRYVGTFGDVSTFSFYGNKTLTTGEGGMVVTNNDTLNEKVSYLRNQALSSEKEYWYEEVGYNYRMTNICAAIGLAQLEEADTILSKKSQMAIWYKEGLKSTPLTFQASEKNCFNSTWMVSVLTQDNQTRDALRSFLRERSIETRPFFNPAHKMPVYYSEDHLPNSETLSKRGLNLPSYPDLSEEEVAGVCNSIKEFFRV